MFLNPFFIIKRGILVKNKYLIISIIAIICIMMILCIFFFMKDNNEKMEIDLKNAEEQNNEINDIKKETGAQADNSLYMIGEEYDGRKALIIKPIVQYKVIMTGIIKKDKPELSEVNEFINKFPEKNGIWISEKSREKFLGLLKTITNSEYYIDSEGYLKLDNNINNEYDNLIKEIIDSNKSISIDISGTLYIVDDMTGEIVEYPFEDMDPYQPYEKYNTENKSIYILTENKENKLIDCEIIKELIDNLKNDI